MSNQEGKLVKSLNNLSCFTKETRILIVGTLTPPEGMAHGYFYSSSGNAVYGKLSKCFCEKSADHSSFAYLKKKLICEVDWCEKMRIIQQINDKLEEHKMAFF